MRFGRARSAQGEKCRLATFEIVGIGRSSPCLNPRLYEQIRRVCRRSGCQQDGSLGLEQRRPGSSKTLASGRTRGQPQIGM